jgi:hypothetical protein
MWILTPSITSAFAAATGELTSASSEQLAAAFARSLLSRSKPSPQRTWLQRLKRDSWTTHLSGAISSDSLGESFTDWWTSSLAATRANPSAQPANASEPKTHDTSGLTYQPELLQCDQQSAFLRMSKDTFLSGCATCCKTWSDWVTERRGAWRQRVNAARLTRGKESGSWPSVTTRDHHSQGSGNNQKSPSLATTLEKNRPTIRASEYKDVGPVGSKSHQHMLGKHYLCAVVTQEETNWPTAQVTDSMGACLTEKRLCRPKGTQLREAVHGQAAQASSSSHGSRQGWWTLQVQDSKHSGTNPTANGERDLLVNQVSWATPRTPTGGPESAQRKQELGQTTSGGGDLASQASGKLSSQWVCALMGLPMGWVSPSCPASVIKNWPRFVTGWLQATTAPTSCDSSGMALCQPSQSERSDFFLASCGKEPTK